MADKFMPTGRQTIRKSEGSPILSTGVPVDGRENKRIPLWDVDCKSNTTLQMLKGLYGDVLAAVDAVGAHKAGAVKSGKFTPEGAVDDTIDFAMKAAIPTLKRARDAIAAVEAVAAAKRSQLAPAPLDKTDAVREMQRREVRDHLRSKGSEFTGEYLAKNLDRLPPLEVEAILTSPIAIPGVSDSHRQHLTYKAIEAQHGVAAVADLEDLQRALHVVKSTEKVGGDEVRREAGALDLSKFDKRAAEVEAKLAPLWLRKRQSGDKEEIRVVDIKGGVERLATPEEKTRGVFYGSFEDYRKDHPEMSSDKAQAVA